MYVMVALALQRSHAFCAVAFAMEVILAVFELLRRQGPCSRIVGRAGLL